MPELPDVEVFRRYLDATALHKRVADVDVSEARCIEGTTARDFRRDLAGRAMEATARRGKRLYVRLDRGGWLMFHFGMTGFFKYHKRPDAAPGHVRVSLRLDDGYRLDWDDQRMLGRVALVSGPDEDARRRGLGPDALDVGEAAFLQRLGGRRGMAKTALVDQSVLAGLGNVYADDVLFQVRVHPRTPLHGLDDEVRARMHRAMGKVLRAAVEAGADPARMPGWMLTAHRGRDGRCPGCAGELDTVKVSGRTSHFCPSCQTPP